MDLLKQIGMLFLLAVCFACSNDDELTQEQEAENLNQLFLEIESLAMSVDCDNSDGWTFTSYGSKACGGPVGYIAYSINKDTELFLKKVEEHRAAQKDFNQKWGIVSDCSVPPQPIGVGCDNGSPVFEY